MPRLSCSSIDPVPDKITYSKEVMDTFEIKPEDLREQTFTKNHRTAVRITHIPTNLSEYCESYDDRAQNYAQAVIQLAASSAFRKWYKVV